MLPIEGEGAENYMKNRIKRMIRGILYEEFEVIKNRQEELMYAQVWHDTIVDIPWIKGMSGISPGRWAVGYNYLYVMTRVMDELKPKKILDIGLGISSNLISMYMNYIISEDELGFGSGLYEHTIIEQNKEWYDAFSSQNRLSEVTNVKICECINKEFDGNKIYAYKGFVEAIGTNKYDVISIDGPWGSDRFSRMDIMECLPEVLAERFVIIIDDTERIGEKDLVQEICTKLEANNIEYDLGTYHGFSDCTVIAYKGGWFTTL